MAGSAHSALYAFPPNGRASNCSAPKARALGLNFAVCADIPCERGDVSVVKGRTIGAAPWVDLGLRGLLRAAGIDEKRDTGYHRART